MRVPRARVTAGLALRSCQRRCISDLRPFQEGDYVLLRSLEKPDSAPILRQLTSGKRIDTHRGSVLHNDILGKRVRDVVTATTNSQSNQKKAKNDFRIFDVTLQDHVRLTRRIVTPLYGADASLIVNLLDLHPDPGSDENGGEIPEPKLEILEAGTGHGALTLFLSRAIHAANGSKPSGPTDKHKAWRSKRRAILHTIEASATISARAREIVKDFKRGMYSGNVDFHVGDVSDWVTRTLAEREHSPFLSHAILDLPGADDHILNVTNALRTDGTLLIFYPSITQITQCAEKVKDDRIPLDLSSVIELGVNGGSGGREWDVRFVRARSTTASSPAAILPTEESCTEVADVSESESEAAAGATDPEPPATTNSPVTKLHLVCRPKVGERIVGGGFIGIWKKRRT